MTDVGLIEINTYYSFGMNFNSAPILFLTVQNTKDNRLDAQSNACSDTLTVLYLCLSGISEKRF